MVQSIDPCSRQFQLHVLIDQTVYGFKYHSVNEVDGLLGNTVLMGGPAIRVGSDEPVTLAERKKVARHLEEVNQYLRRPILLEWQYDYDASARSSGHASRPDLWLKHVHNVMQDQAKALIPRRFRRFVTPVRP